MRTLAVLALLGLVSCSKSDGAGKSGPPQKRKPRVAVEEVRERDVEYVIDAVGTVEAREEIEIPARVGGVIDKAEFKEGDVVTKDKVLGEIDLARYTIAAQRSRAEYDRAKAQEKLAAMLYENRLKLQKEGKAQNRDFVTDEQMATWWADLEKAKADSAKADADFKLAQKNLQEASLRSPIAGIIQEKRVSTGEYVKSDTIVATILDVSAIYVRFPVTELEAARIKNPQEITFTVRGVPNRSFQARVFFVGQKVDESTRSVDCKAEVLEGRELVRAGMFASVKIVTEKRKGRVVPERAVLPTEEGFMIFVVDEQGKVVRRKIEIGLRTVDGVEIIGPLEAGEKLVVDGGSALRPGMEVDVVVPEKK